MRGLRVRWGQGLRIRQEDRGGSWNRPPNAITDNVLNSRAYVTKLGMLGY